MINSVFSKQIGGIMEIKFSKWANNKGKRVKGQACFHPKNSIIDHCITLRHIIDTTWDNKGKYLWCCFTNFKKSFNIILKEKLCERLVEMGVLYSWKVVIHRIYKYIKDKIRTIKGLSQRFNNDIGVKKFCPLFPHTFQHIYINKLEDYINTKCWGYEYNRDYNQDLSLHK